MQEAILSVAGINLHFRQKNYFPQFYHCPSHESFLIPSETGTEVEWSLPIDCYYTEDFANWKSPGGELLFDSKGPWRLYQSDLGYRFELRSPPDAITPYRILTVARDYSLATLYCCKPSGQYHSPITEYPLDELLVSQLLCIKKIGLEVHALGVVNKSKSYLFIGESGAGKSTLAEIWKKRDFVDILSDDRIILKAGNKRIIQYGTPWHGDAKTSSPNSAQIDRIFFLKKSSDNSVLQLPIVEAATRIYVRSFPPFWHREGNCNALGVIAEIVSTIPCFELHFKKDASVLDFLDEI